MRVTPVQGLSSALAGEKGTPHECGAQRQQSGLPLVLESCQHWQR
jgi:hypothetical protein